MFSNLSKPPETTQLVLLRHGQSIWNRDKVFTGWSDVELSPQGKQEAEQAGRLLKEAGYTFDVCFTSELKRSISTLQIALAIMELDQAKLSIQHSWCLNERHYGALEGMGRWQAIRKFGIWPVLRCQLRFNAAPPSLDPADPNFPGNQPRYTAINKEKLPLTESMQQAAIRMQPYWQETIKPELLFGKRILIVAHKNILRTLIMQLDRLSQIQVMKLSIATGQPLIYELDHALNPLRHYYLK
ncbi:phosphoglycerate mutase [Nitrosomonas cryotolerans]|uniref:2,3-bisphosphoglycerate-dependent phosphoglycerate mutase n=1 Tax=Nitrosomonas cryotolerans ATCC 49181 TaxID=1131553 RepID=A0A1N6FL46_9PROT|nr:2,3-bisphosphoglycerate-dependent phosphoglycerate mutase [Nitrosomonas cryotolerans]SFP82373.1 phosphoglycerate mutase [Nitrosomonas cryotolerans]SIN95992.1 phosphoglycerate mutase [Nitrosomonas cryotolerans ATCC 49181]